ncbi:hypothetical protein QFZ40_001611 [Arthrobacter pascens]|nr:hypothetical protein [Arthrobacter pascens]
MILRFVLRVATLGITGGLDSVPAAMRGGCLCWVREAGRNWPLAKSRAAAAFASIVVDAGSSYVEGRVRNGPGPKAQCLIFKEMGQSELCIPFEQRRDVI